MKIEFNQTSYEKILSHSMKYPQSFIDGVLIGYSSGQTNLIITDSFPLSHGPKLPLMVTLGIQYAQGYCDILNRLDKSPKLEIIGFYSGLPDEKCLNSGGSKTYLDLISEKLLANNKNSILVTFSGQKMLFKESMNVYLLRNKQLLLHTFIEDPLRPETKRLKDLDYYNLSDFEDHLCNIQPKLVNNLLLI
ncbi:unnamed protein product [Cryptosporidium hominis]|uniref:ER membrane protein complex subunit 8/9 n=1 Tax=Cryptosporidium hominis TaxID=237895 RepID=A0A0S4TIU6_CRYHO|nr:hypothetical protein [Cryptosporidium hominis TU502]OLQ17993.1 hypothetical protein ChTU502y2012_407g1605 [Cryptosporidium hominis]PPA64047.1 Uncharacterized protein family (UPF0172) family protein [Cryptosporidium hominis]PPS93924.1 ER membrane protein complex subunit 8/9 [Cryptosporidium hominis]CUV07314.1 unnamed protein product [Cryptosporidium hominis]|eukprot:PPS93924.1 ER membrane protein complex subunit 8/9 [Cryptosporidium hominis]